MLSTATKMRDINDRPDITVPPLSSSVLSSSPGLPVASGVGVADTIVGVADPILVISILVVVMVLVGMITSSSGEMHN